MLDPILSAVRAAIVFASHMFLASCVALLFKGFEWFWRYLFGTEEPMLVGRLPLRYLLEIGDGLVVGAFVIFGFVEAVQVFIDDRRRRRRERDQREREQEEIG